MKFLFIAFSRQGIRDGLFSIARVFCKRERLLSWAVLYFSTVCSSRTGTEL